MPIGGSVRTQRVTVEICPRCGGEGSIRIKHGARKLRKETCLLCYGTGHLNEWLGRGLGPLREVATNTIGVR